MELNFRTILIIISVIVIGGIYFHGRLKIRKGGKNPYKLKAKVVEDDFAEEEARNYDTQGFDQDGVGRPKPITLDAAEMPELTEQQSADLQANTPPPIEDDQLAEQAPTFSDIEVLEQSAPIEDVEADMTTKTEAVFKDPVSVKKSSVKKVATATATVKAKPETVVDSSEPVFTVSETIVEDELPTISALPEVEPVNVVEADKPVKVKAKTKIEAKVQSENVQPIGKTKSRAELKRDQLEMDFDRANNNRKVEIEQEVLALSVVVNENQLISGAALLPNFLTLGLKFGEMNIFHRHQDNAGNGKITFSVANMVNPGTFDLDNMESFSTKGITLFMTLPNAGDPVKVFKQMLSAAKQVANEFGGQVLDGQRSVMTKQTEQHYLSKIREFDRKARLAGY
ncbi:cell division protein ZipA [Thalassotalea psychrophila]|uniref:Cell division protein ZipA n=1 Tax=Thalassotalea psychrophila TaxID=3065647 RepID=A0ABY9TT81_9GAMM|nr:cell division protein ZipA [Colwelliaceae bacterium SQ149]